MMDSYFKCETLAQFRIGVWLVEHGIDLEDIVRIEPLALDEVRVTNGAGQYMDIVWRGDHAEII